MKIDFNPIRGTKDYLPSEMDIRLEVFNTVQSTYRENGFLLIKTPILEKLELLNKGDAGDNQKRMFKTIKRGEKLDLTKHKLTEDDIAEEGLRYDLTVPLVRFYCNNRANLPVPFKSIQMDDVFRGERPQRGRYRQFTQCDIDVLGDPNVTAELDVLYTVITTYKRIGIKNVEVRINDRRILNAVILASGFGEEDITSICIELDKLDKINYDGVRTSLLQKGYEEAKVDVLLATIANIKSNGLEGLNGVKIEGDCVSNISTLITTLNNQFAPYARIVYDITIVRGQDYYTGTIFETYAIGYDYKGAIGGGGRYDCMIGKLTGVQTPAVGYGLGLEPCIMLLLEQKQILSTRKRIALFYQNDVPATLLLKSKSELMQNYLVTLLPMPKNFANSLTLLKQNNYFGYVKLTNNGLNALKEI